VFNEQGQPDLQMKISQKVTRLAEAAFEVSLGITVTCTLNGKTAYLAEVEQAGVFGLAGFDEQVLDAMLGTQCPNILYPYATAAVGQLIVNGGFPPFPMQPINFDALYGESLRQRAAQIAQQGGDGLANAETAGNA
jgi:preprotein translocase subunit SecB